MKYAQWEAGQNEFERARSVFERALDVDARAVELWLRYAETELKARNVNHARNVYDRAVTLLPRVDTVSSWSFFLQSLFLHQPRLSLTSYLFSLPSSLFLLLFPLPSSLFPFLCFCEKTTQIWYKYVYLEELLLNVPGARQVFERWMTWEPDDKVSVVSVPLTRKLL
jgi:crooked neck